MHVGILGGTGPAGGALAVRLASVGVDVTIGSRAKERADEACTKLLGDWADRDLPLVGGDNATAAAAEVVVVATPWDGAASTAVSVADALAGKVVICMANALAMVGKEFQPLVPPRGSVAAHVQALVPACLVAGAFHHLPARELAAIDHPMDADVLICADSPEALEVTSELTRRIPGLRPLDAGSLSNAMAIEAMTTVLLQLNRRYKTRAAIRITGIDPVGRVAGMGMRLHDTARRDVVPFEPGPVVTMYTCGITPYDAAHMGHAATYVVYDVLQRRLRDLGHDTLCVRNVTDIDDPLLDKARQLGVNFLDLAAEEMARFDACMEALGLLPAFSEPRATSAIPDILGFIGMVLDNGHAYRSGGAVYFSVSSFEGFGQVSHLGRDDMLRLAAENGGRPDDPNKRDPLDFVLWQPSTADEPAWESLWGPGRPGWHIECSALALRELGTTIDLHGGGTDLIYPHHECEAAQSEAATGEPFVRHWLHTPLVSLGGTKMSKSLGNLVFVSDLLKEWDPAAIRLAILVNHYRHPWDWTDDCMPEAAERLLAWRAAGEGGAALEEVRAALDDDLDTPGAIAAVDAAARAGHGVSLAAALLGVA